MFGYTVPIDSMLSSRDEAVYRNYYCETCHQLRDGYGYLSTLTVNYEMTFASIFFNSILDDGIAMKGTPPQHFCVVRASVGDTELLRQLAAYTVLVANNSLIDDKMDNDSSLKANLGLLGLNRSITKAKADYPEFYNAIMNGYDMLREAENKGENDPLAMGELSSKSLLDVLSIIAGDKFDDDTRMLFSGLGVWVYIMDAVEDLDEDVLDGTYNPFIVGNPKFKNKADYIKEHLYALGELFGSVIGNIQRSYSALRPRLTKNQSILDNIIYQGIPASSKRILRGDMSMSLSIKNMVTGRMNRGAPPADI